MAWQLAWLLPVFRCMPNLCAAIARVDTVKRCDGLPADRSSQLAARLFCEFIAAAAWSKLGLIT